jgi:hypothetical protein
MGKKSKVYIYGFKKSKIREKSTAVNTNSFVGKMTFVNSVSDGQDQNLRKSMRPGTGSQPLPNCTTGGARRLRPTTSA